MLVNKTKQNSDWLRIWVWTNQQPDHNHVDCNVYIIGRLSMNKTDQNLQKRILEKLQSVTFIEHNSASKSTIYFDERGGGFHIEIKNL